MTVDLSAAYPCYSAKLFWVRIGSTQDLRIFILQREGSMILHESKYVRVVYKPGTSDFLLVTFGPRGFYPKDESFWGNNFNAKASVSTIGFSPTGPDWYPPHHMDDAIEAARRVARDFGSVVTYGGSMGGYGALKFSARLGATRSLSFAPQYSIAPQELGTRDKRYIKNYEPAKHDGMRICAEDIASPCYVFYDPFMPLDHRHAMHITAASALVRTIPVYLTGHGPIYAFTGTETGLTLFRAALTDDMETMRTLAQRRRRLPKLRGPEVARVLRARGRLEWCFAFLERHDRSISPKSARQHYSGLLEDCLRLNRLDLYDRVAAHTAGMFAPDHPYVSVLHQRRQEAEVSAAA